MLHTKFRGNRSTGLLHPNLISIIGNQKKKEKNIPLKNMMGYFSKSVYFNLHQQSPLFYFFV